jgi:hypothetical protein
MKDKFYYKDGTTASEDDTSKTLHREDGPAIEYANGAKTWYIDDKRHRADGPAAEYASGIQGWYIEGEYYTEEDFKDLINEIKKLPLVLRLTDPREWVRNYERVS